MAQVRWNMAEFSRFYSSRNNLTAFVLFICLSFSGLGRKLTMLQLFGFIFYVLFVSLAVSTAEATVCLFDFVYYDHMRDFGVFRSSVSFFLIACTSLDALINIYRKMKRWEGNFSIKFYRIFNLTLLIVWCHNHFWIPETLG